MTPPLRAIRQLVLLVVALTAASAAGAAQETADDAPGTASGSPAAAGGRTLGALRTREPPSIDGRLDDPAWHSVTPATGFVQRTPAPGRPASERTEVRILYTREALYVGARMFDARPDSIVARLAPRDQSASSDWFTVLLDPARDRRTAYAFSVNAAGVQRDVLHHDDLRADPDWNAVWEAVVRHDADGWTAEMRIPLSQLRSIGRDGTPWGVNFERHIARREEVAHWAPVPPDASGFVSLFGGLEGVHGLAPVRRLELRPYTVARAVRAPGDAANPFHRGTDLTGGVGADVRWGIGSDFTLTATMNPDFGQIEADPSELNLTTYETWLTEKRPFFLEGAQLFAMGFPPPFYSRRIGRAPGGVLPDDAVWTHRPDATSILAAVKLTGKTAGGWSIGVLDAVTAEEHARWQDTSGALHRTAVEPLTNYAAGRVIRDFRQGRSAIGGMLTTTHRRLRDGAGFVPQPAAAWVGGVDARHRFGRDRYEVDGALRGSLVRGDAAAIDRLQRSSLRYFQRPDAAHLQHDPARESLEGGSARVMLRRLGGGGWRWMLSGFAITPGFEINDLGFATEADRWGASGFVQYERYRPGQLIRRWDLSAFFAPTTTFGGELVGAWADVSFGATLRNGWTTYTFVQRDFSALSVHALRGGPALAMPHVRFFSTRIDTDRRRPLVYGLGVSVRDDEGVDGGFVRVSPRATYRPSPGVELSVAPTITWAADAAAWIAAREAGGARRYVLGRLERRTASVTTRASVTFSPTLSLQFYAQPYVTTGAYSRFVTVEAPRAAAFDERFRPLEGVALVREETAAGWRWQADLDGDGVRESTFAHPDFAFRELRSNLVLRWEWRPGSTLHVAWSHGRTAADAEGRFDLGRDARRLLEAGGTSVLLVKIGWWMGL